MRWGRRAQVAAWGAVVALPPLLYLAVRPDWYWEQNGIEPWFYTSLAANFDDMMAVIGGDYYFVSRWTLYLPQRLLFDLTGNHQLAYLLFRWMLWSVVLASIVLLGRHRWRVWDTVAAMVVACLMPMALRPVLSDYSDALFVAVGSLMVVLTCRYPTWRWTPPLVGLLVAVGAIGNPWFLLMVVIVGAVWLLEVPRGAILRAVLVASAVSLAVVLAGWGWFRWRYGISNVYEPTLGFDQAGGYFIENTRSTAWWLYRTWTWLPVVMVAAMLAARARGLVRSDSVQLAMTVGTAALYTLQIALQLLTRASGLDLPYYWSIIVAPTLMMLVLLVGDLSVTARPWVLPAIAGVLAAWAALQPGAMPELLPHWGVAAALLVVLGGVIIVVGRRRPGLVAVAVVLGAFVLQVAAPRPEPIDSDGFSVDVDYHLVFDRSSSQGIEGYRAAQWFLDVMAALPDGARRDALYWFDDLEPELRPDGRNITTQMAAMYAPHVTGRWWNRSFPRPVVPPPIPDDELAPFQDVDRTWVVVIAERSMSDLVLATLATEAADLRVEFQDSPPGREDVVVTVLRR